MSVKGDTIQLSITVDDDITNWKIRAELYDDNGTSIQKATSNSGGSDNQIEKTDIGASESTFVIKIAQGETANIEDVAYLEIEIDTGDDVGGDDEILTIVPKMKLEFTDEKITWTSPS